MGSVTSGLTGGKVTLAGSTTQTIYNLSCPLANTEYSQALSADVTQLTIRVRGSATAQYTFTSGQSGTNFITIPRGTTRTIGALRLTSSTLYIQTDKANQVVEIEEWT